MFSAFVWSAEAIKYIQWVCNIGVKIKELLCKVSNMIQTK